MQTGKYERCLKSDLEFYQKCFQITDTLLNHITSSDLSDDMIKQFLHKGVKRIENWIVEEIKNIEKLQRK